MTESITPKAGNQFLLKVSDGTSPTTFLTVGGLRNTDLTLNGANADSSNASSNGWQEMEPGVGLKSAQIQADGVMDAHGAGTAYKILQDAWANGERVECQVVSGFGDALVADFVVSTLRRTGPHDNLETFVINITSDGAIVISG